MRKTQLHCISSLVPLTVIFLGFVNFTSFFPQTGHKETKQIYQFHFLSWPDHGVPEYSTDIVNFNRRFRQYFPVDTTEQPVLVHCR